MGILDHRFELIPKEEEEEGSQSEKDFNTRVIDAIPQELVEELEGTFPEDIGSGTSNADTTGIVYFDASNVNAESMRRLTIAAETAGAQVLEVVQNPLYPDVPPTRIEW